MGERIREGERETDRQKKKQLGQAISWKKEDNRTRKDGRKKRGLKKKERWRKKGTRREGEKLVKSREGEGREEGRYFILVGRDI